MPRTKLMLTKETLDELTSDEMSAVVGAEGSNSCTIANVCINTANVAVRQTLTINLELACG